MLGPAHRALVAAVLLLSACAGQQTQDPSPSPRPVPDLPESEVDLEIGEVIAEIDGMPVGANEFALQAMRARQRPSEMSEADRREILDDLLDQKALYLEARRMGLDRDPKVQAQMVQILLRRSVYSQVRSNDFTDEDLRAYYEAHLEDFVIPEKARVRRIFIKGQPVRTLDEAEALARLAAREIGGDIERFAQIAEEVSEGPYRGRGGDIGLISREGRAGIPDEVVQAAFDLPVGQVSEPFAAGEGWNLVALMFKRDKVERTFEQMKGAVLRRAKSERQRELYEQTVARLRQQAQVTIHDEALDKVELRTRPRLDPVGNKLLDPADRAVPTGESDKRGKDGE